MRNCWVRDIADYAKYGILRRLASSDLRLGVLWYLTTHMPAKRPQTAYLAQPAKYQDGNSDLFAKLHQLHEKGRPTVEDVAENGILPPNTLFHSNVLSTTVLDRRGRERTRTAWFSEGFEKTEDANLVFLDPDTGLLPLTKKSENKGGEEYATHNDVLSFLKRGQSVVVVQFGRPGNLEKEPLIARQRLAALADYCAQQSFPAPWGLWWRDTHRVGFLVATIQSHADILAQRTDTLLSDPWWRMRLSAL